MLLALADMALGCEQGKGRLCVVPSVSDHPTTPGKPVCLEAKRSIERAYQPSQTIVFHT